MQNEACIKQGSEKESFRQQLITAKRDLIAMIDNHFTNLDAVELKAMAAISAAADEQRMSPKAFIKAVEAIHALDDAKTAVIDCGYCIEEEGKPEAHESLFTLTTKYHTARAVVLGFEKSLSPNGWDILED